MKKQMFWLTVLLLGIVPFVSPFVTGLYNIWLGSWTMFDWFVMYSFIYWPTYLIGMFAIPIAIFQLLRYNK
ncbi:MAG: hypothetical protein IJD81_07135 [Oscillospiraceae bacterium]|nr:hypothetical protein [Oscillospiraceae bacterium]